MARRRSDTWLVEEASSGEEVEATPRVKAGAASWVVSEAASSASDIDVAPALGTVDGSGDRVVRPRGRPRKPRPEAGFQLQRHTSQRSARQHKRARVEPDSETALPVNGMNVLLRGVGSQTARHLVSHITRSDLHMPEFVRSVVEGVLGDTPRRASPLDAEAASHGMHRHHFKARVLDVAAACFFGARVFVTSLLSHVRHMLDSGAVAPVAALSFGMYDETPMLLRSAWARGDARSRR